MSVGEKDTSPEKEPRVSRLVEWIAEQDSQLAAAINALESQAPTHFSSQQEMVEAVTRAATLAGKRELLDELMLLPIVEDQITQNHPANSDQPNID